MTVTEYIRKKNAIIEKHLGITLVPEDQIIEVEQKPLTFDIGDGGICPYCIAYDTAFDINACSKCIMTSKGNRCDTEDSTYRKVRKANAEIFGAEWVHFSHNGPCADELVALAKQYNDELLAGVTNG